MRAFDNVAGLHLLIAKLLVHSYDYLTDHPDSYLLYVQAHSVMFPGSCTSQIVSLKGFYLAVKRASLIYNRRPITRSHLHMVRMNPNRSTSQPCQLLPSTTCHRDISQRYQRKRCGACASCVLSSVPLN